MFDTVKVGKKIAELRKAKNMTQFELADKLFISFQAVSNWERGNSMPDVAKLPELASVFGVTVDEILGVENRVINNTLSPVSFDVEAYSDVEVSEAAPLLKPTQMERILKNTDYDYRVLGHFLPYLSNRYIEELVDAFRNGGRSVAVFLPFLRTEKITELVNEAKERGEKLFPYLPFMEDSAIKALAYEAWRTAGIDGVSEYLPFMSEKDMAELLRSIAEAEANTD